MDIALRHIGIVVRDIAESMRFYHEVLELPIAREAEERGTFLETALGITNVHVHTVKLGLKNSTIIELLEFRIPSTVFTTLPMSLYSSGITHFAITVDSADNVFTRLSEHGYECIAKPAYSPDGNVKMFFCKDPDGNHIEVVEELS